MKYIVIMSGAPLRGLNIQHDGETIMNYKMQLI